MRGEVYTQEAEAQAARAWLTVVEQHCLGEGVRGRGGEGLLSGDSNAWLAAIEQHCLCSDGRPLP